VIMSPSPNTGGRCPPLSHMDRHPWRRQSLGIRRQRRASHFSLATNFDFQTSKSALRCNTFTQNYSPTCYTTLARRTHNSFCTHSVMTVQLMLTIAQCVVCPSVRLSHSCTLLMPFDRIRCHLADTRVEMGHGREIFGGPNSQSKCGPQIAA